MLYAIVSDIPGRLRLRCSTGTLDDKEAYGISHALLRLDGVSHAEVHVANASVLVVFEPSCRQRVLDAIGMLDVLALPREDGSIEPFAGQVELAAEKNRFILRVVRHVVSRYARKWLLPMPLRVAWTVLMGLSYIVNGFGYLTKGRLTVEVLDAMAIGASLARGRYWDADAVMFLLGLSNILEDHVQSRAHLALREGLITRPRTAWAVIDGQDTQVSMSEVREGMLLRMGMGSVLPVDATVIAGEGSLDEASLTGEARLVHKGVGSTVYAGTALEEGELTVRVTAAPGEARIDSIATLVEQSASLKASVQGKAESLADSLVPLNLLAFFAIMAITRNVEKAMIVLMVDYSCAIKLSTPVAVMSAMGEASDLSVIVKGGKYLEALAAADTVVFDKTGTLTHASPQVEKVLAFGEMDEASVLRYAACIEEHFPHSMARAIVREARRHHLSHERELHAKVHYVVAHGISTHVGGDRMIIGSAHFVFEDEGVEKPDDLDERIAREAPSSSVVYLARERQLVGAICIADPLRDEAREVISRLRSLGVRRVIMLTGDSKAAAAHVAGELELDDYHAQVLPEDKSSHIDALKAHGHTVIMVGDGINDSPALASADVSVALSDASDIARAVADVAVMDNSLESLVTMRVLSQRLMRRIGWDYRFIVGFNSLLIVGGVMGLVPVTTAAYLHNGTTLAVVALNTRRLLRKSET